jgi:predicted membrane protein
VLVVVGIYLIFKPRYKNSRWAHTETIDPVSDTANTSSFQAEPGNTSAKNNSTSDRLQETAVFGNIRKTMITKNFGGGEVSTVFGSAEINLMQADLQQQAKLELNAVFGSIRLIVPTHWQIKMETSAVLGGVEDKRPKHAIYSDKILLLEGNAVFGGIQIESH